MYEFVIWSGRLNGLRFFLRNKGVKGYNGQALKSAVRTAKFEFSFPGESYGG